ncbi:MAG: tyrosine-protein kinase [bacterium]
MHTEAADAGHFMRLLLRGAPIIVLCTVLVMLAALLLSRRQDPNYQASTTVFVDTQAVGSSIANLSGGVDPIRVLSTQAAVAQTPPVLDRAAKKLPGTGVTPDYIGAVTNVGGSESADILGFTVNTSHAALAPRIANAYAQAYVDFRRDADSATLRRAIAETAQQLADLRSSGERGDAYTTLQQRASELRQRELLRKSTATVGNPARGFAQTAPKPKRDAILGAFLGFLLGVGITLIRNTMNTRVSSAREVEATVGLPLLGRLSEPSKRLQKENRLAMLDEPEGHSAEAYRMLSTNIELANLDRGAKSIMVTSATLAEGKSTTIANLAVAYARSGRNVVLVDLDLRRPMLQRYFGLEGTAGLTEVTLGRVGLSEALTDIPIRDDDGNEGGRTYSGSLRVLGSGLRPPDPAELLRSAALSSVLAELAEDADLVLIDAPPVLHVSDAMILTAKVDALILAVRISVVRRQTLRELHRLVEAAPVAKLGFFLTDADVSDDAGYGYGYVYGPATSQTAGTH